MTWSNIEEKWFEMTLRLQSTKARMTVNPRTVGTLVDEPLVPSEKKALAPSIFGQADPLDKRSMA